MSKLSTTKTLMASTKRKLLCGCQRPNKFVKKAFIDYTAPKKPSADSTITKSESDGTFTITAKNLQGFDSYKEVKIPFCLMPIPDERHRLVHSNSPGRWFLYRSQLVFSVTTKTLMAQKCKYEAQVFYVDANGRVCQESLYRLHSSAAARCASSFLGGKCLQLLQSCCGQARRR